MTPHSTSKITPKSGDKARRFTPLSPSMRYLSWRAERWGGASFSKLIVHDRFGVLEEKVVG
jgi:hypothetical protein